MNRTPHATKKFFIGRMLFHFHADIVNDLQEFRRSLKEEIAELRIAVIGQETQEFTSTRLYAVPLFSWIILNFCVKPKRLSAWPTKRKPPGFKQCQNFSIKRFC